ncbi:MAG: TAT-variant-translocated molybdopterin oxidoreductase [Thermoguttaceae bacterium]
MPSLDQRDNSNAYWRSLSQLADTEEFRAFLESEFPAVADIEGVSRRRWLQLMGASLVLAGATGCRWEKEEIRPFVDRPANRTPGRTQRYATAIDLGGSAVGLSVTTVDGRPIKIEGNPKHPASLGATDATAQAAILEFYDPDRNQNVYRKTGAQRTVRSWDDFAEFARSHFGTLREKRGEGFRILARADSSPTLAAMRAKLLEAFPRAEWHQYEPICDDHQRAGTKAAIGMPCRPQFALDEARVIVGLDADLLGSHPAAVRYAGDFATGREVVDGQMNRLYVVESCLSITGASADHRLALRSEQIGAFVTALEYEVLDRVLPDEAKKLLWPSEPFGSSDPSHPAAQFVRALADDLFANRGRSVVAAGPRQPAAVHEAVHAINEALDNVGRTVTYTAEPDPQRPSHVAAIRSLAADLKAGKVRTLLILGGNPAYDAPADLALAELLEKAPPETTIHLSLHHNETSALCEWSLPQAHFLESWGDARAYDGTYSIIQPTIEPLYGGRSATEVLGLILPGDAPSARDAVRETFKQIVGEDGFERRWRDTLHDGLLHDSEWPLVTPSVDSLSKRTGSVELLHESTWTGGPVEIVFCRDASVHDGRFANSGWLQEMPDPITRLTWGNAAVMNPTTADKLGVEDQTLVKLILRGRKVEEMPAYVLPGQATGTVAVALGYGRTMAGQVGGSEADDVDAVGVDVYPLRTSDAMDFAPGLVIKPTGKKFPLATTQDHFAIDTVGLKQRAARVPTLVREATLEHYREHPDFAQHAVHHPPLESLWTEHESPGYRWGMVIDLSKCTGCGACVVACQAENNVPIVGKEQVLRGREMHWLRVDRYFKGHPVDPQAVQVVCQPLPCQQCELAPCEQVCPVAATVHSEEGLNDQVYNRCVGTRYCANNCPYKVRRFNYFNYHKNLADPANEVTKMAYNPEVTIRSRGVMEKCTYCVQRIQAAKIEAKNDGETVKDGAIKTACQQVCPTGAIVFGDLANRKSAVAQTIEAQNGRNYAMLGELNVKPRTTYLAKIRNPNPALEKKGVQ